MIYLKKEVKNWKQRKYDKRDQELSKRKMIGKLCSSLAEIFQLVQVNIKRNNSEDWGIGLCKGLGRVV